MSTHTKKQSMVSPNDQSDILSILESIASMFEVCQKVLNKYTQSALILSITTEAEMLLLKLRIMEKRWNVHLPFKEATAVDFYGWSMKIEQIAQAIGGAEAAGDSEDSIDEFCPSKHYLLDLYECLDESPSQKGGMPYYAEHNVEKFITEQTRIRKQIIRKWPVYRDKFCDIVTRELSDDIGDVIKIVAERNGNIRMTCHTVLCDLSAALYSLYEAPWGNILREQFARLANRVLNEEEYGGRKAIMTVEHEVKDVKNNTPEGQWEARREDEIKVSLDLIKDMKLGNKVFNFLGKEKTILDNPAGFGRFLWSVRNNISNDDLYNLIELLYRIAYLSKDREQQTALQASATPSSQPKPKDAKAVYRERMANKPKTPRLSVMFSEKLANNKPAVECYYKILHHCGLYIGRALLEHEKKDPDISCYEGWKWKHLREAFIKLGFIAPDSSKKGFAEYLASVFPYLEATNIQRGFNSRGGYEDTNAAHRIVADMVNEFDEVKSLLSE